MIVDQSIRFIKFKRLSHVGTWLLFIAALALSGFLFRDGIANMVTDWAQPEYSHGYFLPFIALFMALQRADALAVIRIRASWFGVFAVAGALLAYGIGELSTLFTITQYAFLLAIVGLLLTVIGIPAALRLWAPILFLAFLVPPPFFLYFNLSTALQLVSSELGVAVIRSMGITVFLEGNVIDLGSYKLQVAEACSGLRYLFPLMSFGYLWAFLYRGPVWTSLTLFGSTIPIAILMNSLRIGVIGLLVEHHGIKAAQGFVHLFEGWVVFLVCLLALLGETVVLHQLSGRTDALRDALSFRMPPVLYRAWTLPQITRPSALAFATALLLLGVIASSLVSERVEAAPMRSEFSIFPLILGQWHGQESGLDGEVVATLKLTDYFNANYVSPDSQAPVNLYIAYYASQRNGASVHSPRGCIPGDGWEIEKLSTINVALSEAEDQPHPVNRVVINKGNTRQLVYYWFQQRGRTLTDEYVVKWFILTDSISRNRTDGALIRLVTSISPGDDATAADERLQAFITGVVSELPQYVPD